MPEQSSFTGVSRRRTTSWSVAAGDRVAKSLISVGGIGTIIAVLLVFAYLVSMVVPLFLPGTVTSTQSFPGALDHSSSSVRLGVDEFGLIGWALYPDGRVRAFRMDNGKTLEELSPEQSGLSGMTAASFGVDGQQGSFGFRDGKIRLGQIGFSTNFLEPGDKDLPDAVRNMQAGAAMELDHGMVTRTPAGQFRLQRLKVELEDPLETGAKQAIRLVDRGGPPTGTLFGYCTADGKLRIAAAPIQGGVNLTGESSSKLEPIELPLPSSVQGAPKFLALSGLADYLYAAWENGRLLRYEIRDPEKPRLVEEVNLIARPGATLTALCPLVGGYTLVAGDSLGEVRTWFPVSAADGRDTVGADGRKLVNAQTFAGSAAVSSIASSSSAREVAVGYGDGRVRLLFITSQKTVLDERAADEKPIDAVAIAPKGDRILAATAGGVTAWTFDQGHPDATLSALFLPVWYEGEPQPRQVWQTSGGEGFEPKLGLTPLVFGTLKATFYSMLFGAPLALLAALYTSEFLHPNNRARIKPTIELMASLPSVVLGFLAGLVFAPVLGRVLPETLSALFTIPLALLMGAYIWQLLPRAVNIRLASLRFPAMMFLAIPLGLIAAVACGPWLERVMFGGDIKGWLNKQHGSGTPGWILLLLPIGGFVTAVFMARVVNPWIRGVSGAWSRERSALIELMKFLVGIAATLLLVSAVAWILTGFNFDPRNSLVGRYEQLNSLVVGLAMGFAIIPLIYTIADDALATVPAHLRSASLGAGATPWQTAVRIVIPTAMSGLFSAVMIGLGRAVGETMIVLMAAGSMPIMDINIFNGFQTLSAGIATQMPDAVPGTTHYRILFLAALTLFLITFVINTVAESVRQRFRRRAYEL
jgi:phosphate transport system permease protein